VHYVKLIKILCSNAFAGKCSHQKLGALIKVPLTKWKDAIERFNQHSNSEYHKLSIMRADDFIKIMENKKNSIVNEIYSSRKKQVLENRTKLFSIIETIILCGHQNIALRGHRDTGYIYDNDSLVNDGNFRSLLRFKAQTDSTLKIHLQN